MNDLQQVRSAVGALLGGFMIWYSYQDGPPDWAKKVMLWGGVGTLATHGLEYWMSRVEILPIPATTASAFTLAPVVGIGSRPQKVDRIGEKQESPLPQPSVIDVRGVAA